MGETHLYGKKKKKKVRYKPDLHFPVSHRHQRNSRKKKMVKENKTTIINIYIEQNRYMFSLNPTSTPVYLQMRIEHYLMGRQKHT